MIRIVTDTASDITRSEANKLNLHLVYLPISFEDNDYDQEADESFDTFYNILEGSKNLPKTSQPSPADYLDIFLDAKEKNDEVLVITLSSGLSGTYETAEIAKKMSEYKRITIIDSKQATLSQRMLVYHAVRMRDEGKSLSEIAEAISNISERITVCGVANTLTYLKKGGRIPPAMALIGNTLNIKPVIILKNKKLEPLGKSRGLNNGKVFLYKEMEKFELDTDWPVCFGYTQNTKPTEIFMRETIDRYGLTNTEVYPVGSVVGTHLGPGCILVTFVRK